MDFYGASDIETMISGFGVPVELNDGGFITTGYGIVDIVDTEGIGTSVGGFLATFTTVLVKTGAFPNLAQDKILTLGGKQYTVVGVRQEGDGAVSRAFLRDKIAAPGV